MAIPPTPPHSDTEQDTPADEQITVQVPDGPPVVTPAVAGRLLRLIRNVATNSDHFADNDDYGSRAA
ncbi:hypothetical protein ACWEKT_07640 [Nocardia takedensis]